jgi:hypothetical protein
VNATVIRRGGGIVVVVVVLVDVEAVLDVVGAIVDGTVDDTGVVDAAVTSTVDGLAGVGARRTADTSTAAHATASDMSSRAATRARI